MPELTVAGHRWSYEITETMVAVSGPGGAASLPREKFHCFDTVTTQDVKKFIENGLKPVDYSRDKRRASWQTKHGAIIGRNTTVSSYPEHEKAKAAQADAQVIGEFLEWLSDPARGYVICERTDNDVDNLWMPVSTHLNPEQLLNRYFGIDDAKLEREKRAILAAQRKANEKVKA